MKKRKEVTPQQIQKTVDDIAADIHTIFAENLPAGEVQAAIDELHERLPLVHYTAFALGFSAEYCDNAQSILILDILRARRQIKLADGFDPHALIAFILGGDR